jgi:hypothetical protein
MGLIKIFCLAVATIVTVTMAFLSAGTAKAGIHESIGFCLKNETLLCAPANLVALPAGGGLVLSAEAKNAEFTNAGTFASPEKCTSKTGLETKEVMNNPIAGKVVELAFTECKGPCKNVVSMNLSWPVELKMTIVSGTEDNLIIKEAKASVLFSNCTFGVSCEFGIQMGKSITLTGVDNAEGAIFKASSVPLPWIAMGSEFLCGNTVTWTAEYKATGVDLKNAAGEIVTKHGKWWLTLLGEKNVKE